MYGTAISLGFLALGSIGFLVLLVTQTIRIDHESPPAATVALAAIAFAVFSIGTGWAIFKARRHS